MPLGHIIPNDFSLYRSSAIHMDKENQCSKIVYVSKSEIVFIGISCGSVKS